MESQPRTRIVCSCGKILMRGSLLNHLRANPSHFEMGRCSFEKTQDKTKEGGF